MDAAPAMGAYRALATVANLYNYRLGANVRFQALPTPFDIYTDGIENPVIEEFGAGTEALHLEDLVARRSLMAAPVYRDRVPPGSGPTRSLPAPITATCPRPASSAVPTTPSTA